MGLTQAQNEIHRNAILLSREHRRIEWLLVEALIDVEENRVDKELGHASLFVYGVKELKFSPPVAYTFISVARRAVKVGILRAAIKQEMLTVAAASRMASVLTQENARELIDFAMNNTVREVDYKVAQLRGKPNKRAMIRAVNESEARLSVDLPKATLEKLRRARFALKKRPERFRRSHRCGSRALP